MANKEMLINVSEGEECRIAILQDGKLEELYMERSSSTSHVGNIYKGRVTNVEPSIQAAFVDFGLGRNGFLHISDLQPSYFGRRGEDIQESVGRKMARRDRPPIQRCLRRGDEIIVQIIKEGIGTKGPTLSTYLSIPGRILVMMPGMGKMGVSRKIEDDEERRRLRQILDSLKPPKDVGFIIRTAGVTKSKTEIQRDLTYLTRLWQTIEKKRKDCPAPVELYTEGDLVTRTVRDVFSSEIDRIVIDDKEVARQVKEVIKLSQPRTKNKVELHEDPVPLFHKYGIEKEIEQINSRHVPLPSGGSLVIDSTEAIVAIDVNSGKFRDHSDAEMTAFRTDMEAADEIPRQLKLRDLGGVIICDFIDLRYERHRRDLEKKLHDNFRDDRAKTKVLRMSQFGIIELTRQRMRPSLKRSIYYDCPHCHGAGLVKTPESMSLDVMRRLAIAAHDQRVARVELAVCPDVSFYLNNRKRQQLAELEESAKKRILIRADATLGPDEMRLGLYDLRDGLVFIEGLTPPLALPGQVQQVGQRPPHHAQQQGRGGQRHRGGDDRRGGRGGGRQQPPRFESRPQVDLIEARAELDEDEEEREERQGGSRERAQDRERYDQEEERSELRDRDHDEAAEAAEARAGGADDEEAAEVQAPGVEEGAPQGAAAGAGTETREDGGRRRRRRRGRRGRGGRGRAAAETGTPAEPQAQGEQDQWEREDQALGAEETSVSEAEQAADEAAAETAPVGETSEPGLEESRTTEEAVSAEPTETDEEGKPKKRRRRGRRGGRRRRGRGKSGAGDSEAQSQAAEGEAGAEGEEAAGEASPEPATASAPTRSPRGAAIAAAVPRTGSADRHLTDEEPVHQEPVHRPRSSRDLDDIPDDLE